MLPTDTTAPEYDAIVVGAGFAGLYALHRLRKEGFRVKVLETAPDVGGTWYWNRYPGARCDAQSLIYCYLFDQSLYRSWRWSEHYATQGEILKYIRHIADVLDLRRDISFETRVAGAAYDEASRSWVVETEGQRLRSRFLVMASGALSVPRLPDIPGVNDFRGEYHHTSGWPEGGVDFAGKRVGVIGTGSSGVQAIPVIAKSAAHVTVFQRTAAFVAPARNGPLPASDIEAFLPQVEDYRLKLQRGAISGSGDVLVSGELPATRPTAEGLSAAECDALLQARWDAGGATIGRTFADTLRNEATNAVVAGFFRRKIAEIVKDPETARRLTPSGYPFGAKRICVGADYYETFNRSNVALVSLAETPIEAVTSNGVRTKGGEHPLDMIVFATGFDAITGALTAIDIRGIGGLRLRDAWRDGPRNYLGLAVSGFPNLFMLTGPGSPASLSVVTTSIEHHVDWVTDLLIAARSNNIDRIEASPEAEAIWTRRVAETAAGTLFMKADSWYLGANVPGKPRVMMTYLGGMGPYRDACEEVACNDYSGFLLSSSGSAASVQEDREQES